MIDFKIAVDCVIIGFDNTDNSLKLLLTKRVNLPEKDKWALPGGFVIETEPFEETAKKILKKETALDNIFLRQLGAYSLTDPSENNRIASVVYFALIRYESLDLDASRQISEWFPIKGYPRLPFDHGEKVLHTINVLKQLIHNEPMILSELLPKKFPLNQLQRFYEELYDRTFDNRNFRKKMKALPYIKRLDEMEKNVSHRPGHLYRFEKKGYRNLDNLKP